MIIDDNKKQLNKYEYFTSLKDENGMAVFSRSRVELIAGCGNELALEKALAGEEPFDSEIIAHYLKIYVPKVTYELFRTYSPGGDDYSKLIFDTVCRLDEREINNFKHLKFCSNPCGMDCI